MSPSYSAHKSPNHKFSQIKIGRKDWCLHHAGVGCEIPKGLEIPKTFSIMTAEGKITDRIKSILHYIKARFVLAE